jgi:hypothetical protein
VIVIGFEDGNPNWLPVPDRFRTLFDSPEREETGPHGDRGRPPYGTWTIP